MKKIVIKMIEFYKKNISFFLASNLETHCKYEPSCSEYCKQAIEKYGVWRGGLKSIKRIIRCNPFSKGGYDPLK